MLKSADKPIKLDDLLAKVTSKNLHPATDWGKDVGKEVIDHEDQEVAERFDLIQRGKS
jgi:hypothetical protein